MKCTFATVIFSLFAATSPAHAAYVQTLNANIDLKFDSSTELTGAIGLEWLPVGFMGAHDDRVVDYVFNPYPPDLSVNGVHISPVGIPDDAFPAPWGTIGVLAPFGGTPFHAFGLNTSYLLPDPTFANFLWDGTPATSGTVTVLSETIATPLPPALPLFGSGLIALAGLGYRKRRCEVSRC